MAYQWARVKGGRLKHLFFDHDHELVRGGLFSTMCSVPGRTGVQYRPGTDLRSGDGHPQCVKCYVRLALMPQKPCPPVQMWMEDHGGWHDAT